MNTNRFCLIVCALLLFATPAFVRADVVPLPVGGGGGLRFADGVLVQGTPNLSSCPQLISYSIETDYSDRYGYAGYPDAINPRVFPNALTITQGDTGSFQVAFDWYTQNGGNVTWYPISNGPSLSFSPQPFVMSISPNNHSGTATGFVTVGTAGVPVGTYTVAVHVHLSDTCAANRGFNGNGDVWYIISSPTVTVTVVAPPPPPPPPPVSVYTLTVATVGSGTVVGPGGDPNCGTDCTRDYNSGIMTTVAASPDAGYVFSSWSGCDSVFAESCTITMNSNRTVTATLVAEVPLCNTTISCTGACTAPANTCAPPNNGTQSGCVYTAYTGGGACTQVAAPNQSCPLNNCTSPNTCPNGSCVPPPPGPFDMSVNAQCSDDGRVRVRASWTGAANALSYRVSRVWDANGNGTIEGLEGLVIGSCVSSGSQAFEDRAVTDAGRISGRVHRYFVLSFGEAQCGGSNTDATNSPVTITTPQCGADDGDDGDGGLPPEMPTVALDIRKVDTGSWGDSVLVNAGENVELRWSSTNATRCAGDTFFSTGAERPVSGTQQTVAEPAGGDRTYRVTCHNGSGPTAPSASDTASVTVFADPDISVDPEVVLFGGRSTLSWRLNGHQGCSITGTNGDTAGANPLTGNGSEATVDLFGETRYAIACTDDGSSDSVTIRVRPRFEEI